MNNRMKKSRLMVTLILTIIISACGKDKNTLKCSTKQFEIAGASIKNHFYGEDYVIHTSKGDRFISELASMKENTYKAISNTNGAKLNLIVYKPFNIKDADDVIVDIDDKSTRSKYRETEICDKAERE